MNIVVCMKWYSCCCLNGVVCVVMYLCCCICVAAEVVL